MIPSVAGSDRIVQAREVRSARIEGLRAVGALGVLFAHIFYTAHPGAYAYSTFGHRLLTSTGLGAFMLMGLSGYLLFWPYVRRDYGDGEGVALADYARNRMLRLLPAYYVVLVVALVWLQHGGTWNQWWRFATFTENFSHSTIGTVDGPMWTLVVELCFYILLPIIAFALGRLSGGRPRVAAALLLALVGGSVALYTIKVETLNADLIWQYSPLTNFFYLGAGMLLAFLRLEWQRRPPRLLRTPLGRAELWLAAAFALWLWIAWKFKHTDLIAISSFLTIGAYVLPLRRGPLTAIVGWRPVAAIGVASYSLYLWHGLVLEWLTTHQGVHSYGGLLLAAGGLSILVALVSYRVIEAPFLGLRRRWSVAAPSQGEPAGPTAPAAASEPPRPVAAG